MALGGRLVVSSRQMVVLNLTFLVVRWVTRFLVLICDLTGHAVGTPLPMIRLL